jgi:hypothetical protein
MILYKSLLPLFLIIPWNSSPNFEKDYTAKFENAGNGADRCVTSNCTCAVVIPPKKYQMTTSSNISSSTAVYFTEDSSTLTELFKNRIDKFLEENPKESSFTTIGYTDGCGSYEYNKSLSLRRASEVSKYIKRHRTGAKVSIMAMSEMTESHSDTAKRVDVIAESNMVTNSPPPNLEADFYLLDYSGSMLGKVDHIERLIAANKKSRSRVYISYDRYCTNGQNINSVSPRGSTEIWYSYWWILDRMSHNQTLIIFSDFDSMIPLTRYEQQLIDAKVRSKNITVYAFSP